MLGLIQHTTEGSQQVQHHWEGQGGGLLEPPFPSRFFRKLILMKTTTYSLLCRLMRVESNNNENENGMERKWA